MRLAFALLALLLPFSAPGLAQPANDDCANATVVTSFPFVDTVDVATATVEPGEPEPPCNGPEALANTVWYRIPAGSPDLVLRASTSGSTAPDGFVVSVFTGSCGALTEVDCKLTNTLLDEFGIVPQGEDVYLRVALEDGPGVLHLGLKQLPEFLVSPPPVTGFHTSTAGGPNGFLVAWTAAGSGPMARLFDTGGGAVGSAFTLGSGSEPDVAAAGTGKFVVVWEGTGSVEAARVDGPGTVVDLPAVVTGGYPRAAADADGDFVVVWEASDGSSGGIFGQRFDADGNAQGSVFQVNTYTTGSQEYPAVAMAPSGEFVVTWVSDDGDDEGISARRFHADGTPLADEFIANQETAGDQTRPGVGTDAAGNFVVVWEDLPAYFQPFENPVVGRRFDATGAPLGDDFAVVTTPDYWPQTGRVDVAVAAGGDFVVTWETYTVDSDVHPLSVTGVAARRFDATGAPEGPQFFVNTLVTRYQYDPDVGVSDDGHFLVVWEDYQDLFPDDLAAMARLLPDATSACTPIPVATCRHPTVPLKSKLLLIDDPDPVRDLIRWTWTKGQATDVSALGDPLTSDGYLLCLYDGSAELIFDASAPAGGTCGEKPCWKGTGDPPGATGFKYNDKERTPEGLQKLVLKAGIEGKAKVVAKGGGPNLSAGALGMVPLPLILPARLQLQGPNGECWETTYSPEGLTTNVASEFNGKGG